MLLQTDVLFEEIRGNRGHVGLVTLNRPHVLNALNDVIIKAMFSQLTAWATNSEIKAVVITGSGERAFCAGGDLRLTYALHQQQKASIIDFFREEYQLNRLIYHYPKPYIAWLNGITMGGGVGVSIHGSHRIATERLVFAMPETGIGLFPDVGGTYFLPRLPHHIGFYLGLTGEKINADECVYLGIAEHKLRQQVFPDLMEKLVATSLENDAKENVTQLIETFAEPMAPSSLLTKTEAIDHCFSKKTMEAILDELSKFSNPFCQQSGDLLKKKSPTSLKITLAALQRGKQLTFDHSMDMEYALVTHCLANHDFFEGIRALIIDKDQKPKWQPADLREVTQDLVDSYFII